MPPVPATAARRPPMEVRDGAAPRAGERSLLGARLELPRARASPGRQ